MCFTLIIELDSDCMVVIFAESIVCFEWHTFPYGTKPLSPLPLLNYGPKDDSGKVSPREKLPVIFF